MERLTKTYNDGTHGVADNLPCGENSHDFKNLLIQNLGKYEDTGLTPKEVESLKTFDGSQAVKATKMLQKEQRKHRWIPVSERIPEYDGMYLACFDDEFVTAVAYETDMDGTQDWELWADSGEVVAWMPLPEPYKEDEA